MTQMSKDADDWWRIVKDRTRFFATVISSILLDSFFVFLWAILHQLFHKYGITWVEQYLSPDPITEYVILGMKAIFDVVTLATVLVFIYADFRKIISKILATARDTTQQPALSDPAEAPGLTEAPANPDGVLGKEDVTKLPVSDGERIRR
jgi:hypothetical protein